MEVVQRKSSGKGISLYEVRAYYIYEHERPLLVINPNFGCLFTNLTMEVVQHKSSGKGISLYEVRAYYIYKHVCSQPIH
jgi:hypothetical protein